MPIDQLPAGALSSPAAAAHTAASHSVALRAYARQWAGRVGKFYAILGLSGSATLLAGVVLALSCTALAIRFDVPYQVALAAGYITVAASACICAALVAVRHSAPGNSVSRNFAPKNFAPESSVYKNSASKNSASRNSAQKTESKSVSRKPEADYAAWSRVDRLRVADASRLWCGIEPGHYATPDVMAWAAALLEAIERGELPKCDSTGRLALYKIGWHTEVPRDALKAWAKSKGHAPRFLCD